MSVCRFVRSRISKIEYTFKVHDISWAVARSSFDDSAIRYVFPVSSMTSYFLVVGPTAGGISNIYVSAVLEQVVINFQRIRQVAPHCLTVVVYSGSKLRTEGASDDDMWGAVAG